jgi:hypothetical protein
LPLLCKRVVDLHMSRVADTRSVCRASGFVLVAHSEKARSEFPP